MTQQVGLHYARLSESPRLQRLLSLLSDKRRHSTRDIILKAHVCAVNSAVAELRANDYFIICKCIGKGRYEYQLD